jgi:predicted nucleic acid-binding protein
MLRHNVTAYDAAYVALAETLSVTPLTCDARLATSHGHGAMIEIA